MQMLARNPAATYRRVELDARIEASGSADLTRICLEEAHEAVGRAVLGLERRSAGNGGVMAGLCAGREALTRAQTIMLWLARSVTPGHPLATSLTTFYGGLAARIGANILHADGQALAGIRSDIKELIEASR